MSTDTEMNMISAAEAAAASRKISDKNNEKLIANCLNTIDCAIRSAMNEGKISTWVDLDNTNELRDIIHAVKQRLNKAGYLADLEYIDTFGCYRVYVDWKNADYSKDDADQGHE